MKIDHISSAALPNRYGAFTIHVFADPQGSEHPALTCGDIANPVLLRIHSGCMTGDIFGSLRCDCQEQLNLSMEKIAQAGAGMLIYLRHHEGRGIGLGNKIRAYALQDQGQDTVTANLSLGFAADLRDYAIAAAILRHFAVSQVRLLTNNPAKIAALEAHGTAVIERLPLWTPGNLHNDSYLETKRQKLSHISE